MIANMFVKEPEREATVVQFTFTSPPELCILRKSLAVRRATHIRLIYIKDNIAF
jgi:hypothetical protein